ncbi:MAG: methyltransferase [Propionibacteriaceae bacterium]|nr:methyltransferase [Propionibacteriaceae bacterium]
MSHYFEPSDPVQPAELRQFEVRLAGAPAPVVSAAGVFSNGRLDLGTAVLLRAEDRLGTPAPTAGHLLDLGCGWGPIALSLARLAPGAVVWAVDSNPRALQLTALNAERLGLANVRPALPDAVPPGLQFDLLWSNPPIRIGKPALHQLLRRWLGRLRPGAHADLVVQKNLGADSLSRWLGAEPGWSVTKLASAKGYRVIRAARQSGGPDRQPQGS